MEIHDWKQLDPGTSSGGFRLTSASCCVMNLWDSSSLTSESIFSNVYGYNCRVKTLKVPITQGQSQQQSGRRSQECTHLQKKKKKKKNGKNGSQNCSLSSLKRRLLHHLQYMCSKPSVLSLKHRATVDLTQSSSTGQVKVALDTTLPLHYPYSFTSLTRRS